MQVYLLLCELQKLPDIFVSAVLLNHGELASRLAEAGVNVTVISEDSHSSLAIIRKLRAVLLQHKPHVIHSHRNKENIISALANGASLRTALVRTQHGAPEHYGGWRRPARSLIAGLNEIIGKWMTRKVVAVSNALAQSLARKGYSNTAVIPNGVDVERIEASLSPDACPPRDELTRNIGFIGRLEPVKRPDLFLEIAAELHSRDTPFELNFHLFGDGSQRLQLETIVEQRALTEHVTLHGHDPNITRWLKYLDALVLCSDHEGLPMILLEAMTAGVPVVAHAVGGIPEVMAGGNGGLLVKEHNASTYAYALLELLAEPPSTSSRDAVRRHVLEHYSSASNASRMAGLYRSLVPTCSQ